MVSTGQGLAGQGVAGQGLAGPQALLALEEALADIRRDERDAVQRMARASDRVGRLRLNEIQLLRALVRGRGRPDADRTLGAAEHEAEALLREHAGALARAETERADIEADLARLTRARDTASADRGGLEAEIGRIARAIAPRLGRDPALTALGARVEEADASALRLRETASRLAEERDAKAGAFLANDLFAYLLRARFGTRDYRAKGVRRRLDTHIAALIGFQRARQDYELVENLPQILRAEADRRLGAVAADREDLARRQTEAINEAGGAPIRTAIGNVVKRISALDADLVAAEARLDDVSARLSVLAGGRDETFRAALKLLGKNIEAAGIGESDARSTDDPTIVLRIEDARTRVREEDHEIAEHGTRLEVLARRRRELVEIVHRFKAHRYDDPKCRFEDAGLCAESLDAFLRGTLSAVRYWRAFEDAARIGSSAALEEAGAA